MNRLRKESGVVILKLSLRELRGLGIVAAGGQIQRVSDEVFIVKSQGGDRSYEVRWAVNSWVCNCPDYLRRSKPCKHIYAVNFLLNLPTMLLMNREAFDRNCPYCGSSRTILKGFRYNKSGAVRIRRCKNCGKWFKDAMLADEKGNNALLYVVALDLYYKGLSVREIKHHLKQVYNVDKSASTVHRWILKLTGLLRMTAKSLKAEVGDRWLADETVVKVDGEEKYVWNIMDYDTRLHIASLLVDGRSKKEALKVITEALKLAGKAPLELVTDGLKSYSAALAELALPIRHLGNARLSDKENNNNRIERLNGTLKEWIKSKKWLKNHAQEVVDGYRAYYNYIRPHIGLNGKPPTNKQKTWLELIAKKNTKS